MPRSRILAHPGRNAPFGALAAPHGQIVTVRDFSFAALGACGLFLSTLQPAGPAKGGPGTNLGIGLNKL